MPKEQGRDLLCRETTVSRLQVSYRIYAMKRNDKLRENFGNPTVGYTPIVD